MRSVAPRHNRRFHEGRRHKWDRTQHTCIPCLATVFQLLNQTLRAGLQKNMFRNQWTSSSVLICAYTATSCSQVRRPM